MRPKSVPKKFRIKSWNREASEQKSARINSFWNKEVLEHRPGAVYTHLLKRSHIVVNPNSDDLLEFWKSSGFFSPHKFKYQWNFSSSIKSLETCPSYLHGLNSILKSLIAIHLQDHLLKEWHQEPSFSQNEALVLSLIPTYWFIWKKITNFDIIASF